MGSAPRSKMDVALHGLFVVLLAPGCSQPPAVSSPEASIPDPGDELLGFVPLEESGPRDLAIGGTGYVLDGWSPYQFEKIPRQTEYSIVEDGGRPALAAFADDAASAVRLEFDADPQERPRLIWEWKVESSIETADCATRAADDCAARLLLLYRYEPDRVGFVERTEFELIGSTRGEYPPLYTLVYAWMESRRSEEFLHSPYSDRVRVIPVRRGSEHAGRWVREERNHLEDFRKAFGGEQPTRIEAVAILVDTDNTHSKARAWFRSVRFAGTD